MWSFYHLFFCLHRCSFIQLSMLPASIVAKDYLHCEMLFWNHWSKRWRWITRLNILIFPALDAHSWASCFARSKVDILQNVQWHGGAVLNIMYFLYCSIHCTFYCWAIKLKKYLTNLFVWLILLKIKCNHCFLILPSRRSGIIWFVFVRYHTYLFII